MAAIIANDAVILISGAIQQLDKLRFTIVSHPISKPGGGRQGSPDTAINLSTNPISTNFPLNSQQLPIGTNSKNLLLKLKLKCVILTYPPGLQ